MRKLMLWGAAVAVACGSTAGIANVVVVKSLGPSAKAYPPGKTLPESAKISLQGGDVVTVIGPSSAQTLRGPGNFDAKQVALASAAGQRGRFGALRAAEVAHNPSIWDIDVNSGGKVCVADAKKLQLWRPDSDADESIEIRSADGAVQKLDISGDWGTKLAEVKALSDVAPWRLAVVLETSDQSARIGLQPARDPGREAPAQPGRPDRPRSRLRGRAEGDRRPDRQPQPGRSRRRRVR